MLTEGVDFYYNDKGLLVLTSHYLLQRGYCCGNGCKHCPYHWERVPKAKRVALMAARADEEGQQPL